MKEQETLIRNFQLEKDSSLILLDACRYDFFEETYPKYFQGVLTKAFTKIKHTPDFFNLFWGEEYDINFFNAVEIKVWGDINYNPEEHFKGVYWLYEHEETHSVQDPFHLNQFIEDLIREGEVEKDSRKFIRYCIPHIPYKGTPLEGLSVGKGGMGSLRRALQNGEITKGDLRMAYRQNVKVGMKAASDLCEFLDEPIIITSDHGEFLGDNPKDDRILHGRYMPDAPEINQVPWFEVKRVKEIHEEEVKGRLSKLGYI